MIRALLFLCLTACPSLAEVSIAAITERRPVKLLSDYGFFDDLATMAPATDVVPYDIIAPLFTDGADKARYVYTPTPALTPPTGVPDFPVGAALIKTFHYDAHKVETRVLLHQDSGWKGWTYVWTEDGTEAHLKIAGANLEISTDFGPINYRVPNANQCKSCHIGASGEMQPIGPKLRNLAMGDQLVAWAVSGILTHAPTNIDPITDYRDLDDTLARRARAYLDANCAHCHAPGLPADTSGLYLNWDEDRPIHIGVGKHPVAAGRGSGGRLVDIDPGNPDGSIIVFRMESNDPGIMMPELGRSIVDEAGVELIRAYIAALD